MLRCAGRWLVRDFSGQPVGLPSKDQVQGEFFFDYVALEGGREVIPKRRG